MTTMTIDNIKGQWQWQGNIYKRSSGDAARFQDLGDIPIESFDFDQLDGYLGWIIILAPVRILRLRVRTPFPYLGTRSLLSLSCCDVASEKILYLSTNIHLYQICIKARIKISSHFLNFSFLPPNIWIWN